MNWFVATIGFAWAVSMVGAYLLGRTHNPTWEFENDLERKALEAARSEVCRKVIDTLSEPEEKNGEVHALRS